MSHHDVAHLQILHQALQEIPPVHPHHIGTEMNEHHIVDPVATADDLLPADGAIDEGNLFAENQGVRMHVKAQHRGHDPQLCRPLLRALQQLPVPDMHAVKKAQRNDSLCIFHQVETSKKLLMLRSSPFWMLPRARKAPSAP